jgi:hypothetical protein
MLTDYYNNVASYLTQTFGANFIFLIFFLTTGISVVYFIALSYIITQMDKGYFVRKIIIGTPVSNAHPAKPHFCLINASASYLISSAKIMLGLGLLLCGIAMLVLPGQGLLTILVGLSLLPFPGKDKLEQNLLARKSIRASLNWIRTKANKEPFIFD